MGQLYQVSLSLSLFLNSIQFNSIQMSFIGMTYTVLPSIVHYMNKEQMII